MKSYEKFISEPELLEETLQTIQEQQIPERFDQHFLESIGLQEPNTIFYVRLFKNLSLVTKDGRPHPMYYSQFVHSEKEAKSLLAKQMKETAYKEIFEENYRAHTLTKEEIHSLFKKLIGSNKSDTIIRLAADTFSALANYASWNFGSQLNSSEQTMESKTNSTMKPEKDMNEEIEKASSGHEEFILELMNGEVDHQYSYNGSAAADDHSGKDEKVQQEYREKSETVINQSGAVSEKKFGDEKTDNSQVQPGQSAVNIFVQALQRKAELLERLNRAVDAVNAYDKLIVHADKKKYPIESDKVLRAFYKKATLLDEMNNYEEALENYDNLLQRFPDSVKRA